MLLVGDLNRPLTSVRPEHVWTPFVPDTRHSTVEGARDFLCRLGRDNHFLQTALRRELAQGWGTSSHKLDNHRLIDAAAHGIATGAIRVAVPLRKNPTLLFNEKIPHGSPFGAVGFPNPSIATALLTSLRGDSQASAAIARALEHEAGRQWLRDVSPYLGRGPVRFPKPMPFGRQSREPDAGWNTESVAALLVEGWLMMLPLGLGRSAVRLVWRQPCGGGGVSDDTATLPQAPVQLRPVQNGRIEFPAGPRSVLPNAPTTLSPQADALLAAARLAYPFCEECAQHAAELAREAASV